MRTPVETMMGLAENEIKGFVFEMMSKNNIPPGLMVYILKGIQLDITEKTLSSSNNNYLNLQLKFQKDTQN